MLDAISITSVCDIILFLIGLFVLNKFLVKENNLGFTIRNSSYPLAYAIAISGSFLTPSISFGVEYILFSAVDVVLVISLLLLSMKINSSIILHKLDNDLLIKDGNLSIPIIESGLMIATSIILFSSMYGEGKYTDGLIFFILGQSSLFGMVLVYEKFSKFDDFALIKQNNISVALIIVAMVIGFSSFIGVNIFGDSSPHGLAEDIFAFLYFFAFGVVFLIVFINKFLDKVFFPYQEIEDEIEKDNFFVVIPYAIMKLSLIFIIAIALH